MKIINFGALSCIVALSVSCKKNEPPAAEEKKADAPAEIAYTREGKPETIKVGSAFLTQGRFVAIENCDKVTCDMFLAGGLLFNKADAVCPGGYRWVQAMVTDVSATPVKTVPLPNGTVDKDNAKLKPTVTVSTKNNEGSHGWNYSTAKQMSVNVQIKGTEATVDIDAADTLATVKATGIKAQVCP